MNLYGAEEFAHSGDCPGCQECDDDTPRCPGCDIGLTEGGDWIWVEDYRVCAKCAAESEE